MVQSKTELFSKKTQETAELFKALSHPARIEIINFLLKQQACYCGNITDEIPLSRTTINQHLAELKRVGLIKGTVSGSKVNYCLCGTGMAKLQKVMSDIQTIVFDENVTCDINIKKI